MPYNSQHYDHDDNNDSNNETRIVAHGLRFENLTLEFNALMQQYQIQIQLSNHRENESHDKKLNVANITLENIRLVNEIYHRDFEAFGYNKLVV